MTRTAAEWRELSLLDLTAEHEAAFLGIVADVPHGTTLTVNDLRHRLDAAGVPVGKRGGLFGRAVAAGLLVGADITVHGTRYPRTVPSTGDTAHGARVRVYRRTHPQSQEAS